MSDIIVSGRYVEEERSTNLKWRGSTNQRITFNNKSYQKTFVNLENEHEIEIHIDNAGRITLVGYPENDILREVMN